MGDWDPEDKAAQTKQCERVLCRDLGSHIDGFVATAAHTVVVQSDAEAPVKGKAADVIAAANTALEAAIRLIRPGKRISEVLLRPKVPLN